MTDHSTGLQIGSDGKLRCFWSSDHPDYMEYHDEEWGVPVCDGRALFEKVCLEGFQSGLSWLTILRKRSNFRDAFDGFDYRKIADYHDHDVDRLMNDSGIVRHRGKIVSVINNARRACDMEDSGENLASFFWSWEPSDMDRPATLNHEALMTLSKTPESTAMAKDLKRRGWSFVGPTTAYAFMQSVGIVNDHIEGCFARDRAEALRLEFQRP